MKIYLDNAATTRPKPQVNDSMYRAIGIFGNPSGVYSLAQKSRAIVDTARENVAKLLNANDSEVYFTSGGSESDNWAIVGIAFANRDRGKHIITSKIEHKAVLNSCEYLSKNHGFDITYLDVDESGTVRLSDLEEAIRPDTILISIMYVNNEVGSIQPIKEIAKIAKSKNILIHTDAVQAVGNLKIDVKDLDIDLLSLSGHKFYGPKGIGSLYVKKGTRIHNLIHGGAQENGKRAGTENVIAIAGLGKASEIAISNFGEHNKKIRELKEYFVQFIKNEFGEEVLILADENSIANILGICIKNADTAKLLILFDKEKISVSGGAACTSGSLEPSYVLQAMGVDNIFLKGFLRFSFSDYNKKEELDEVFYKFKSIMQKLIEK